MNPFSWLRTRNLKSLLHPYLKYLKLTNKQYRWWLTRLFQRSTLIFDLLKQKLCTHLKFGNFVTNDVICSIINYVPILNGNKVGTMRHNRLHAVPIQEIIISERLLMIYENLPTLIYPHRYSQCALFLRNLVTFCPSHIAYSFFHDRLAPSSLVAKKRGNSVSKAGGCGPGGVKNL